MPSATFLDTVDDTSRFRNYEAEARSSVKEFYRLNHTHQTLEFARLRRARYESLDKAEMGIWEAMDALNTLVDDSDPDLDLPQIYHALQTAEAIRRDGHPRWFVLTGFIHDLGKVLVRWDEPQWAVVGDTFPVGCAYSERIVYYDMFEANPDRLVPEYQTANGIYNERCGLDNVTMSWGHDEYLYLVTRDYLPPEALAIIRYHSCYAIHQQGAYRHLMNEADAESMRWVQAFNPYDLYSKSDVQPDLAALRPYYEDLIAEFFPSVIKW